MAEDDYSVSIDGLMAGRIVLRPAAFGASRWFWTITGPAMVQAGLASAGEDETLEYAQLRLREAFDKWLEWALTHGGPVYWMG